MKDVLGKNANSYLKNVYESLKVAGVDGNLDYLTVFDASKVGKNNVIDMDFVKDEDSYKAKKDYWAPKVNIKEMTDFNNIANNSELLCINSISSIFVFFIVYHVYYQKTFYKSFRAIFFNEK
jgi:hypothetical protein